MRSVKRTVHIDKERGLRKKYLKHAQFTEHRKSNYKRKLNCSYQLKRMKAKRKPENSVSKIKDKPNE